MLRLEISGDGLVIVHRSEAVLRLLVVVVAIRSRWFVLGWLFLAVGSVGVLRLADHDVSGRVEESLGGGGRVLRVYVGSRPRLGQLVVLEVDGGVVWRFCRLLIASIDVCE